MYFYLSPCFYTKGSLLYQIFCTVHFSLNSISSEISQVVHRELLNSFAFDSCIIFHLYGHAILYLLVPCLLTFRLFPHFHFCKQHSSEYPYTYVNFPLEQIYVNI